MSNKTSSFGCAVVCFMLAVLIPLIIINWDKIVTIWNASGW